MTPFRCLQGILLLLLLGIGADGASPPPRIPLEVEYAGCGAVLMPGPACVPGKKRQLRLWARAAPEAQIEIRAGGEQINAAGEPVQDGQRFSLTLPPGAERVDVLVETANGRASWSLSLTQAKKETSHDDLREVNEQTRLVYHDIRAGRLAAARETLASLRIPAQAPAESRYLMSYYRGLLAETVGDYRSALAEVQESVKVAERVKLEDWQWFSEQEMALLFLKVGRFHEAAQVFDHLRRTPHQGGSCVEAALLNNQAWSILLAREAGENLGDPAHLLERALKTYETCKRAEPEEKVDTLMNLALAHLQEGRLAQARNLLSQAHELEPDATTPHKLWWLELEARIALGEGRPAEALKLFADLQELALVTSSADGRLRAAFGEARSQEALRDRAAALEALRRVESLLDEQSLQVPLQEGRERFMAARQAAVSLHVELLLKQDRKEDALAVARHARSRVLRQLERGDRLANLTPDQRRLWEQLLTDYQEKRAALEERAKDEWRLPSDQRRRELAAKKVDAEAVKKLLDQALLVLVGPQEAPGEELSPPGPGELLLAYYPLSHGWAGFADDGRTVAACRFELPADLSPSRYEELSRLLLLPFSASIEKARKIRILPSGPLQGVDFHELPFNGDILLARTPVVYGLDLPVSSDSRQALGRHALLVADPRDDLPGALAEARTVGQILESGSRSWTTEELKGMEASAVAVRNRFAAADLLHYAGHGTFSGLGGWESGLLLAQETRLTLGDILALPRVPPWVVLSGCDTGRSSTETSVESLGLAQAFLLAGSRAVVASIRPADDREVPAFFTELYRQWDRETDLAVALQRAQLSWRRRNPGADWAGFRLFEP